MDITTKFLECAERQKLYTEKKGALRKILSTPKKTPVLARALEILRNIDTLDKFLHDHNKDYINIDKFFFCFSQNVGKG